ncbi:MAG: hypothetical protein GF393_07905 [Armatimonadia bacterium]|nr:hypothetical protein [Armatimonadia bacterium]
MGRWQALVIAAVLAQMALPAFAQGDDQPGPAMPGVPGSSVELYEDVQILRTVRTLSMTGEQLGELVQINADVVGERRQLADLRERMWDQYEDDIEEVLGAWMAGEEASRAARSAADSAVNRVNRARSDFEDTRQDATEALYDILTDAQRDLVESPGVAEARAARRGRMGGTDSVGEYLASELDAIRDLMPDEFELLAGAEAQRIARNITGPEASNLPQMADAVLDIMLEVFAWTPDRYREQRPTLSAQIERNLGFAPVAERAPVGWTDLMQVATSDRTSVAVGMIEAAGGGEAE